MKKLYEEFDSKEISVFENLRKTVIREMAAIPDIDAESCVIHLVNAGSQISRMQQFALHKTELKISDIPVSLKKKEREVSK